MPLAACLLAVAATGCLRLGPDYRRPDDVGQLRTRYQHGSGADASLPEPDDRWWTEFGDPELDGVVAAVLASNQDILSADDRVRELRALARVATGARLPTLDAEGAWRHRESYAEVGGEVRRVVTKSYDLTLPAFFEVDVWGRLAYAEDAALESVLAAEENRMAVAQTLVAEAVRLYFEIESIERRIAINTLLVDNFKRNLAFVERRYRLGLANVLDVRQARRILAESESLLPALRRDLGASQQRLGVLMGGYPETRDARTQPSDYYRQMATIPSGIPSDLLRLRPDIRSAEARLRSLNDRVGEAIAARFPRISLTGALGLSASDVDVLFDGQSRFWEAGAGLAQPLFDGGRLAAEQEAAEARYDQEVQEYRKAVLTAISEVERALLTRREEVIRRSRLVSFLEEAKETQRTAEDRYARGLTPYLDVLDAQRARFRAEENIVSVDLALMVNRVNLHLAVGGRWGGAPAFPEAPAGIQAQRPPGGSSADTE